MSTVQTELDPITLEVYWNRLITIMDEVDLAVVRTAVSTIISESRDFAVTLLDTDGVGLAQSGLSLAHFTVMVPRTCRALLERFPAHTLRDGDVLITNDPWIGSGHLPDVNIVKPVFHRGKLVAFIGCVGHVADMGGSITYFGGHDVYEEGLRIPPAKLYKAGEPTVELFDIISANVRVPDMVLGDIRAMLAAAHVGERQIREFLDDAHLADIQDISHAIQGRCDQTMRDAIAKVPAGTYQHTVTIDGHPDPQVIAATVTVKGDSMLVDFEGSSPETRSAGVNCPFNATCGDVLNALKAALVPDIPQSEALFRAIEIKAPVGSLLNCRFPAPVKGRSVTCLHTHEAIYGALASAIPDKVQAGSGIALLMVVNGTHPNGQPFNAYVVAAGGVGAPSEKDGLNTAHFPVNCSLVPTEIFENHVPLVMTRKELVPGSGGAGRQRGGLGQRLVIRTAGTTPATITLRPNNRQFPPPGLLGGDPGSLCEVKLNGDLRTETVLHLGPGDVLDCSLPGGGGFGPASERDPELVARDRALGYETETE